METRNLQEMRQELEKALDLVKFELKAQKKAAKAAEKQLERYYYYTFQFNPEYPGILKAVTGKTFGNRVSISKLFIGTHNYAWFDHANSEWKMEGELPAILRAASTVIGQTFPIQKLLKQEGFYWNRESKSWSKPTA